MRWARRFALLASLQVAGCATASRVACELRGETWLVLYPVCRVKCIGEIDETAVPVPFRDLWCWWQCNDSRSYCMHVDESAQW